MRILDVAQRVALGTGMAVPETVFSSTERTARELATIANQAAETIAGDFAWPRLKRLATITGDGVSEANSLPNDFDRFPGEGRVYAVNTQWPLEHITDHNLWLEWKMMGTIPVSGAWTVIGGKLDILPVDTRTFKFYYQSNKIVRSNGTSSNSSFPYNLSFELADSDEFGYAQTSFTTDDDHFQLDWKLLERAMVWQWKAGKGLPYAEDLQSYNVLLAQKVAQATGQKPIQMARTTQRERDPRGSIVIGTGGNLDGVILNE